jgi:multidrug resistance protein, MATE family
MSERNPAPAPAPSASDPTRPSGAAEAPREPRLGALLRLAWPIVIARATQSVIGFCDALMVAPLGEAQLAAATTGALDTFAFIVFPMGTVFIVQSFVSQLRGAGDEEGSLRYALYGLALAVLAGVLALACAPAVPLLVGLLDAAPEVREPMAAYIVVRLLGVLPAIGIEALGNYYGGLGNTRPSMVAGVIAMVANIALNFALIEPRFGLPGYGVAGAAWASTVATFVGFAVIGAGFVQDLRQSHRRVGRLRLGEFGRMLRFGVPNGVNWFLEFASFAVFINVVMSHLGTTALAAFNVVIQVNSVSFMPAFGLSSAGAIMVGEAIGRRAFREVAEVVRLTAKLNCLFMGALGLVYLGFSRELMQLFAPRDGVVGPLLELGASMLVLSSVWQLFDAVGLTLGEALRAAGDTAFCMALRVGLAWLVFLPLGYVIVWRLDGSARDAMFAQVAYMGLLAGALYLRYRGGRWREISLLGPAGHG